MDIFTTTVTVIEVANRAVKGMKTVIQAQDTAKRLAAALDESKQLVIDTQTLVNSVSPEAESQDLVDRTKKQIFCILEEYKKISREVEGYFVRGDHRSSITQGINEGWKGLKWVVRESSINGRIEEIHEQDDRLRRSMEIYQSFQIQDTVSRQRQTLDLLQSIQDGLDTTKYFGVVNELPAQLQPSPIQILAKQKSSPPSWVLDNKAFLNWHSNASGEVGPWLWVLGEAGAGKSNIATFLAHYLLNMDVEDKLPPYEGVESAKQKESKAPIAKPYVSGIAIYYCTFKGGDDQTTDQALRGLLRQFMQQLWEASPVQAYRLLGPIKSFLQSKGSLEEPESTGSLLKSLLECFDLAVIVIDGLDELKPAVFDALMYEIRHLRSHTTKFIFTSREGLHGHAVVNRAHIINASDNGSCARTFVYGRLHKIAAKDETDEYLGTSTLATCIDTEDKVTQLGDRIITLANGNFLWAEWIIKQLLSRQPGDLSDALQHLTSGLDQLVQQAMDRIEALPDKEMVGTGRQALLWAIYTRGPAMELQEFQQALAFCLYSDDSDLKELRKEHLARATSYFLTFGSEPQDVSVHSAIKEVCAKSRKARSYFGNPHSVIAKTCLGCLHASREDASSSDEWEAAISASPFLKYAAKNWGWHLRKANETLPPDPFPSLRLMELLKDDRFLDTVTMAIQPQLDHLGIWQAEMWEILKTKCPPISALHILAFFNLPQTANIWIENGKKALGKNKGQDWEAPYSPLFLASKLGHDEMVGLLISRGARPNRPMGPEGLSAFMAAVAAGHEDVVDTMMRKANDRQLERMLSIPKHSNLHPLRFSCGNLNNKGNLRITKKILQKLQNMPDRGHILRNQAGPIHQSVLHRASTTDNVDIVQALLDFPDGRSLLELRNRHGKTALMNAAKSLHRGTAQVVQVLVQAGADATAQSNNGCTAAHYAAMYQSEDDDADEPDSFALLLEKSDMSLRNHVGQTPLHLACQHGRWENVVTMTSHLGNHSELLHIRDKGGFTPIGTAALLPSSTNTLQQKKEYQDKVKCIEQLIPLMADDISAEDADRLLALALRQDQRDLVRRAIDRSTNV